MNGNVEEESTRPRPQSAGIWTLFSWLRRSDHSSSESITSVGSDRTAASFDFLAPLQYRLNNPPLILPSSPPTDTYKKRLHERNVRRLRDRDISIHRKYGLLKVDEARYDTFNLTSTCSDKSSFNKSQQVLRERRATSECVHRRAAYVPGKRPAPQPPLPVVAATLPRSYKRKRPAPKPPNAVVESNKENFEINQLLRMNNITSVERDTRLIRSTSYVQKSDARNEPEQSKDKSFLKQIFVSKKRNSAIDTSHIKLLPNISELDKQALEIIERKKALKADVAKCNNLMPNLQRSSGNVWICTSCLRRYTSTVTSCVYCVAGKRHTKRISMDVSNIQTQTEGNASISKKSGDDREKLKEMLKEMKDSLPKRSKHEKNGNDKIITEISTLRIGTNLTEITKKHDLLLLKSKDSSNDGISADSDKGLESKITKMSHEKEKFFNSPPSSSTFLNTAPVDKKTRQLLSEDISNTASKSSVVQPTKPIELNNVLINTNNNPLNFVNIDKVSMKGNNNVYEEGGKKHTEILNKKSPENNKILTQLNKIDLQVEMKNQSALNLPLSTHFIVQTLAVNGISPNLQLQQPNNNDNTKAVSSDLPQQREKPSIEFFLADNSKNKHAENTIILKNLNNAEGTKTSSDSKKNIPLDTPLKISSLLNPLYSPKSNSNEQNVRLLDQGKPKETAPMLLPSCSKLTALPRSFPTTSSVLNTEKTNGEQNYKLSDKVEQEAFLMSPTTTSPGSAKTTEPSNPYSQRRILISQLEQSISKGDEKTAADVAAKLAKLKLSCSVLSFSSQIVADSVQMLNNENLSNRRPDIIKDIGEPINNNGICKNKPLNSGTRNVCEGKENNSNDTPSNNNDRNGETQEQPSTSGLKPSEKLVFIEVWIEDKETTRGPIRLRVSRECTMKELMRQAETSLGLAIHLQRWIVGKTLCTDNNVSLSTLAGPNLASPFYLCLVESDITKKETPAAVKTDKSYRRNIVHTKINNSNSDGVYTELIRLEKESLVPNLEPFECVVCMENRAIREGVVLRECLHTFCRECLADAIRHCEEPVVSCLEVGCFGSLQERELRALLSLEEYEKWLARSLTAAECGTRNTFHCRTRDCKGWAFCEPGVRKFPCPVCKRINCVECQAVHEGETCKQYQEKLQKAVSAGENNQTDDGTKALLNSLISRGEALECPECRAIITKKWGCDWVKCAACKTEICWVTRGRRWGPAGRGDTSAGCRCGVDGQRCHPSCGYCH